MLTLQQIIDEADILVPNAISDKVSWLNHINQDFFTVVKIPKIVNFNTVKGTDTYTLASDVRAKNIDKVQAGLVRYRSGMEDDFQPTQNYWTFDDDTKKITLQPAPYQNGKGLVRYHRIATTTFVSTNLNASPDAPEEYHWTFIPALCERICLAISDDVRASNFNAEYTNAWNTAALNYQVMS